MKPEYVRNLNRNYQRIALEEPPQQKRYQYCILERGGFKHLLACNTQTEDGTHYLYYDISSTQNLVQMFSVGSIDRDWMKRFLWGMQQMKEELRRYLLEDTCIVFHPEYIYQDLEKNNFFFTYIPYYTGEPRFKELLDFIIDRMDYKDDCLVEFVYKAYEKYRVAGIEYCGTEMEEDFRRIIERDVLRKMATPVPSPMSTPATPMPGEMAPRGREQVAREVTRKEVARPKRGLRGLWAGILRREEEEEALYCENVRRQMNGYVSVAETGEEYQNPYAPYGQDAPYMPRSEEEYGKTIYIEETKQTEVHGIYNLRGELVMKLDSEPLIIGKRRDSASLVLNDYSASRIHARIMPEGSNYYIEDLNSTNGTFKNGLRLQPYERRKLEPEDELRFARSEFVFR